MGLGAAECDGAMILQWGAHPHEIAGSCISTQVAACRLDCVGASACSKLQTHVDTPKVVKARILHQCLHMCKMLQHTLRMVLPAACARNVELALP
jgi:hypothetical protein